MEPAFVKIRQEELNHWLGATMAQMCGDSAAASKVAHVCWKSSLMGI